MVMQKHTPHTLILLLSLMLGGCLFCSNFVVLVDGQVGGGGGSPAPPTTISTASWCVARSDASDQALQTALDYACSAGADCTPLQPSGLCYLPNNLFAHASYAYNSYYQRKAMAPGSCNFAGTATIAKTDPSFGSCVYPSSLRAAGGAVMPSGTPGGSTNPFTNPYSNAPPPPGTSPFYGNGGLTPGLGPGVPNSRNSKADSQSSIIITLNLLPFLLVIPFVYEPM